ncbi:MAG: hypothetical protein A3G33_10770 [Omnitrophica bacterium RIFCSPLOWO2_12_FULL_44_17]|uniref:Uncharacterized protein n=1 Tax=Candidatus Danuiimicrobium aquiferis TaxID=1801832 RepID=A0A1G1KR92_9BACT|nr:MAG: hypothetical protein A3B72_03090 [Omnitrophica bacterium RIFCSPHIGHO2_02_FULL_45_28]OGW88957.1 MAG: hypothetical protein A3E74_07070 [Omnitrophica bacterium RIFCSPHIGHO2_12_FULL_44_12]OGW95451.1 MAG: hypothetical protein A3G33_10770 [Omnitrophica bacterium RIFCSPLOWO2_12_FULL_44_17]OGX03331.1 MAG: hypothetical protein A3J12_07405 [Omnitrophica bacterium RIFCSPLOWO2_02_FULL_44_11]
MINKITQKVISVGTFAVLARILDPSTFGLFAMAFILIDGFQIFKSFGFDSALIQRKENIEEASHTAYFIVQGTGVLMFLLCYLAAPVAAGFLHNQEVTSIIRALGFIFVFSSFARIPSTLLTKQMRFNVLAMIDLIGAVVNSAVAITLALISPTVWALVWAYLLKQLTVAILTRKFSGYRLKWKFDTKVARELFRFGKFMMGLSILYYFNDNINNIVIAKILGATALGYYALSANIGNFINTHFTYLLEGVMFPAYSSIQQDREEVKRVYLKTVKLVSIVAFPFCILLIFLAKEFTLTLYGAKWLPIVPLIRFFGVIQMVVPVYVCSGSLFMGCGRPDYLQRIALYQLLLQIPALILFTKYLGVIGAVVAVFVTFWSFLPLNINWVRGLVKFQIKEFLQQFLPSIYCAGAMTLVMLAIKLLACYSTFSFLNTNYLVSLFVLAFSGAVAYVVAFFYVDRALALETKQLILNFNFMKKGDR